MPHKELSFEKILDSKDHKGVNDIVVGLKKLRKLSASSNASLLSLVADAKENKEDILLFKKAPKINTIMAEFRFCEDEVWPANMQMMGHIRKKEHRPLKLKIVQAMNRTLWA